MAMEDIVYQFIGRKDEEMALDFLGHFTTKTDNQYSWQNCFVGEVNGEIISVANVYDGADLHRLRQPVIEFVRDNYNPDFNPEPETQPGEMYLDCFAVKPSHRGRGFGTELFSFLVSEFVINRKQTLGLLVDKDNHNAQKLYKKMGFTYVNDHKLMDKNLEHWQVQHV